MSIPAPCDHEALAGLLEEAGLPLTPAEIHGVASALLVARVTNATEVLMQGVMGDLGGDQALADRCRHQLDLLVEAIRAALEDEEFGFNLCLPDEERPLPERAAAVRDWCRGFLFGIGLSGLPVEGELREILADMTEISRMETEAIEEDEAQEAALTEIEEYLRLGVMSLREAGGQAKGGDHVAH